jgi:aspartate 1-decarboxylase
MTLEILKAKIHRATITEANLEYEGSISIDKNLLNATGMIEYEKVHVLNINTGARLETYIIEGEAGSGVICLNGAAARLGQKGDKVIIITYCSLTEEEVKTHQPIVVSVDSDNRIING